MGEPPSLLKWWFVFLFVPEGAIPMDGAASLVITLPVSCTSFIAWARIFDALVRPFLAFLVLCGFAVLTLNEIVVNLANEKETSFL